MIRKTWLFFTAEGGSGANRTRDFSVKEKYLMLYSIQSQRLYCFRYRGSWNRRPLTRYGSPYFLPLLAILQWQCPCLLQVSNAHIAGSSKHAKVMSYMKELSKPGGAIFLSNQNRATPAALAWLNDALVQHFLALSFFHILFSDGKSAGRQAYGTVPTAGHRYQ